MVHDSAFIEDNVTIGDNTNVWHLCHIRKNAKIGEDGNFGMAVFVDEGVQIGNNCKVQNKVSIYRGVTIEDDVFVGPHAVFTNDMYPRANNTDFEIIPTLVKKGASIGANATIRCGITIGEFAMIGAGSVVTKDVEPYSLVLGNPAKHYSYVCECGRKVPEIASDCGRCTHPTFDTKESGIRN